MPDILLFAIFFSPLAIFNSVPTEHCDIQNTSMPEVKNIWYVKGGKVSKE